MLTLLSGALAGLVHVLAGPDHVAAVAPLAVRGRRKAWITGWTWGVGHASGVVTVALLAVMMRDVLPPIDEISAWSERLVGGALIGIGFWALKHGARIGPAPHRHGWLAHDHPHVQAGPLWLRRLGHAHASFCMGILHGIAGSSHFLGVLPALAMPTTGAAFLYVAAFGAGTVVAMTMFAAAVGMTTVRVCSRPGVYRSVMTASAVVAIGVGGLWLTAPLY